MTDRYNTILEVLTNGPVGQINGFGGLHGIKAAALDAYIDQCIVEALEELAQRIDSNFLEVGPEYVQQIADMIRLLVQAEISRMEYEHRR